MRQKLVNIIFMSKKRKDLLLSLEGSPKTVDEVLKELDVSRVGMLPQIKILNESKLIEKDNGTIRLSKISESFIHEMRSFLSIIDVLEMDYGYWTTRNLDPIPEKLLRRIDELSPCRIVEPDLNDMFEIAPDLIEGMFRSKFVLTCSSFIHPSYHEIYAGIVENKVRSSLILTEAAFEKLNRDNKPELERFLSSEYADIRLIERLDMPAFIVTDSFLLLWLFNEKGDFEARDLISYSQSAIGWGKELFQYYLDISKPVKGLCDVAMHKLQINAQIET